MTTPIPRSVIVNPPPEGSTVIWDSASGKWAVTTQDLGTAVANSSAVSGTYVSGGPGNLSEKSGLWVPSDWGRYWKTARNASGSSPAVIACLGDSITTGYFSSSLTTKGYAGKLAVDLQAIFGDGGSGFFSASRAPESGQTGYSTPDQHSASTGTWALWGANEGPGKEALLSSTVNSTRTFQVRGSTVKVFYVQATANTGSFSWAVDGVGQGTINTVGGSNTVAIASATGLSTGNHTVVITITAGGNNGVFIFGVAGENATGVRVNNFGRAGSTAAQWAVTAPTYGYPEDWSGGISYPSDLFILALGVNDAHANNVPDTFMQNIAQILRDVKDLSGGRNGKTDVVVLMNHVGNDESSSRNYYMAQYVERVRALADHWGAAFINQNAVIGTNYAQGTTVSYWGDGTSDGNAGSDVVHPGDIGHALIESNLLTLLKN